MRILLLTWEYPPVLIGGLGRHVYELCHHLISDCHNTTQNSVDAVDPGYLDAVDPGYLDIVILTRSTIEKATPLPITTIESVESGPHGMIRVIRTTMDPIDLRFSEDLVAWVFSLGFSLLRGFDMHVHDWIPHVVHAHDWLVAQPAITLAQRFQVPLISTIHATEAGRHTGWISQSINRHIHSLEYWLAHNSNAIISCSDFMRSEIITAYHVEPQKVITIPNGIDRSLWSDNIPHRQSLAGRPKLLFFGRLEYEKGIHTLIEAFAIVLRSFPDAVLEIVGAGTQQQWLHQLAKDYELTDHIYFRGQVDALTLVRIIDDSSVAIFPSIYEPFGLVALEAAARAIPIIVSARSGLAEFVESAATMTVAPINVNSDLAEDLREDLNRDLAGGLDENSADNPAIVLEHSTIFAGSIAEPGNYADLARAIITTLDNYPLALAYAQRCYRKTQHPDYCWTTIAAKTYSLYLNVLTQEHQHREQCPNSPRLPPRAFCVPDFPDNVIPNRP